MTAAETARARHRLYALLGRLLVEGPSEDALRVARVIPAFQGLADEDPHELAAGHYAALTEVPPVLSAVLGEDGLVGGPLTDVVRDRYRATGFYPGRTDVPPDHLGLLLACAGHLSAVEAEAHDDGLDASYIYDLQRSFLDDQLLSWLPAWVVAVRAAREPFWTTVAELALELVVSQRSGLGGTCRPWRPTRPLPDLSDPATSLGDIGAALVHPSASGWLPGRRTIGRACLAAGVPAGFGDRGRVLGDAMRAAAELRRLPVLIETLKGELDGWTDALASLAAPRPRVPGAHEGLSVRLGPTNELPIAGWLDRARSTAALLQAVLRAAEHPEAAR